MQFLGYMIGTLIVLLTLILGSPRATAGAPGCDRGLTEALKNLASDSGRVIDRETGVSVRPLESSPQVLYHWTKYDALSKIAKNKFSSDPWSKFGDDTVTSQALQIWPQLRRREGVLFAWENPVTGMAGSRHFEKYGEIPVRLEIRPDAKVLEIVEPYSVPLGYSGRHPHFNEEFNFDKYDLVIRRNPHINEWIILRPSAIANFTADPNILKPELTSALADLSPKNFNPGKVHYKHFNPYIDKADARYAQETVSDFITNGTDRIPRYFLKAAADEREEIAAEVARRNAPTPAHERLQMIRHALDLRLKDVKKKLDIVSGKPAISSSDLIDEIQLKREFEHLSKLSRERNPNYFASDLPHFLAGEESEVKSILRLTPSEVAAVRAARSKDEAPSSTLHRLYARASEHFNDDYMISHFMKLPKVMDLLNEPGRQFQSFRLSHLLNATKERMQELESARIAELEKTRLKKEVQSQRRREKRKLAQQQRLARP